MRIWFDTEFIEDGKTIDLISIALVGEDGSEYYALNNECDHSKASEWVVKNVFPHLGLGPYRTRAEIASDIRKFAGQKPEFWAYYADYDWVALCQLYGRMVDLPDSWPMFCRDVKQLWDSRGNPSMPTREKGAEHHALYDARWAKKAWAFLNAARPEGVAPFPGEGEKWIRGQVDFYDFIFQSALQMCAQRVGRLVRARTSERRGKAMKRKMKLVELRLPVELVNRTKRVAHLAGVTPTQAYNVILAVAVLDHLAHPSSLAAASPIEKEKP